MLMLLMLHPAAAQTVVTLAGSLSAPLGVAFDASQRVAFVTEKGSSVVRGVHPNGSTTTVAGSGVVGFQDGAALGGGGFCSPGGLALHSTTGLVFVADNTGSATSSRLRVVDPATWRTNLSFLIPGGVSGVAFDPSTGSLLLAAPSTFRVLRAWPNGSFARARAWRAPSTARRWAARGLCAHATCA